MPTTSDILADAEWLPHVYDAAQDRVLFAHLPQETRAGLTFLADHKPVGNDDAVWIAADEVRAAAPETAPVHFVFHSAFCRSTLFVRALGAMDGISGLSEPAILNTLQSAAGTPQGRSLLGPVLQLLGRPIGGEGIVVIKPSNFANGLIPEMLSQASGSRAVILYGGLHAFLRSVAKKGLSGRMWARKQLAHTRTIMPLDLGMEERAFYELTDLQTAALTWLLQMNQFAALLQRHSQILRSIESDGFIDRKAQALAATAGFFGAADTIDTAETVANGPLFASHAKLGGDYAEIRAEQDAASASEVTEGEIGQIATWIEVIASQLGLTLPLAVPLLPDEH